MSAMRYSGELRIRVTYLEAKQSDVYIDGTPRNRNGSYRCHVSVGSVGIGSGGNSWINRDGKKACGATIIVGAPAHLSHAVDSPEAFDSAARAALSFAHNAGWPVESHAAYVENAGWHIGRSPSKAWPAADDTVRDLPPVLDPSEARKS